MYLFTELPLILKKIGAFDGQSVVKDTGQFSKWEQLELKEKNP